MMKFLARQKKRLEDAIWPISDQTRAFLWILGRRTPQGVSCMVHRGSGSLTVTQGPKKGYVPFTYMGGELTHVVLRVDSPNRAMEIDCPFRGTHALNRREHKMIAKALIEWMDWADPSHFTCEGEPA